MNSIVLFFLTFGNAVALRLPLRLDEGSKPVTQIGALEEGVRKCNKCNCKALPDVSTLWQGTIDKFAERQQSMPISASSIRGAFQRSYPENHHRLQLAAEKLLSGAGMNIFVIGGSLTAGGDCDHKWSDQLQKQLRSQLGLKEWGPITVVNAARSGTRADWFLNHISNYEAALNSTDIFINEYHFNDGFNRKKDGSVDNLIDPAFRRQNELHNEKIYQLVVGLPKKPAFIFFDTPAWTDDVLKTTSQESIHYAVAQKHEIPLLWHVDAVKQSGHVQMDHKAGKHPDCFPAHEVLASEMSGVIHQEMTDVCAKGVQGKDITETIKTIGCEFHPSFAVSASQGAMKFKPMDNVGWTFGEDVKGKPGWIAKEGSPSEISFSVPLAKGDIKIEYLRSYENIGSTTCQLENSSGSSLGTLELTGLWDIHASLSEYAEMSVPVEPGSHTLRCRSDGKKSKIMSIVAC